MTMATHLAKCLGRKQCRYEIHHRAGAGTQTPTIPHDRLARTILLEDQRGYLIAVFPASHHLRLAELRDQTGRALTRVHGDGVREVFRDCHPGALPPAGYGVQTWLDDSLLAHADVYFEAGDRDEVVHMRTGQFGELMAEARHGHFSHRLM